jgi:hypothetical protein
MTNTTAATSAGTWHWIATYNGDDNDNSVSSDCAQEPVTVSAAGPAGSCQSSASLSTLVSGSNVIAYIPKGGWESTATGVDVVSVEGQSITNTVIPTGTDVINSCASNSFTGQTVCTANNTHVYVLRGTGLDPGVTDPLTDGGSGTIQFSGGSTTTADVSMDTADNKALIALSVGGVGGFQFLDLASDTFEPAFTSQDPGTSQNPVAQVSESALMDSVHHRILSAAEDNNFEVVDVSATQPQFFEHPVTLGTNEVFDSTAEDCATGIAFAPAEFVGSSVSASQVEIADLSNGVFTPGTPGSWTAPEQVQTLTGSALSAGPSGSAVAQGTHTGVLSGEFGALDTGNADRLTALALPSTSGTGAAPAFPNWVSCRTGAEPSGAPFVVGDDPHTLAAYQSPNGGDAMALLVNDGATEMVKVDLTQMLDPGTIPADGNVCSGGTLPSSVESFIPLP